jgi:drug/metabolite transporter (DMT)-like permease
MSAYFIALLCIVGANVIWSSVGLLIRLVEAPKDVFLFYMAFFAILTGLTLVTLSRGWGAVRRIRFRPTLALYPLSSGLLGLFIFYAYADTDFPVAASNLILNSSPLLIVLLAPLMIREVTRSQEWVAALIGFTGLAVFVLSGDNGSGGTLLTVGLALALAAWVMNALSSIWARSIANDIPPVFSPLLVGTGDMVVALGALAFSRHSLTISQADMLIAAVVGMTTVGFAYWLLIKSYQTLKVQTVSIIGLFQPVLTALLAMFFFQEYLTFGMMVGALIVLSSIVYLLLYRKRRHQAKDAAA